MRGDSLRDLYAKALAVVGLGLLAGAGAIVDYWPVDGDWPEVTAVAAAQPALPALDRNLSPEIPAPEFVRVDRPVRAMARTRPEAFAPALRAVSFIPEPVEETVEVPEPQPLPVREFVTVDASLLPPIETVALVVLEAAPMPEPGEAGGPGAFFSDALRRTRETLHDARTFLGDKFHGMVGAFRRVSPFFSVSAIESAPY